MLEHAVHPIVEPAALAGTPWVSPPIVTSRQSMLIRSFQQGCLFQIRSAVAAHASRGNLDTTLADQLLLIASELVLNAIRHGGGQGLLRLWTDASHIHLQVEDAGPGMIGASTAGLTQPAPGQAHGRGLWVVRTLSDLFRIDSGTGGTTVTAALVIRRALQPA